ncbi:hypothetical protein Q2T76_04115 [Lactobacillus sp. YT155]|uniref:hypothetical protein n=1 Tax=Lactobacillus sp. YT155 TaxID=3060955 RepID=UPI00265DA931|nr:hypothetical protein [Lactobacillus sp. YT155]MDO1605239.1 hypothetical protein [Lactobacillus sp. YT155]
MLNPFYLFIASFSLVIGSYLFGWSSIYPEFSQNTILFFALIFVLAGFLGYITQKTKITKFKKINTTTNIYILLLGVLVATLCEGIYSHGFPLLSIAQGQDSAYTDFGIPVVHVILLTFNAFLTTYIFHLILSHAKDVQFYIMLALSCIPYVLEVNRGMFMMVGLNCVSLFLMYIASHIKIRHLVGLLVLAIIALFGFGIMGNARVNTSYGNGRGPMDSAAILSIGKATPSFEQSKIPKLLFWGYLYSSSPIANFQKNVDYRAKKTDDSMINAKRINHLVFGELMPDFLGKRALDPNEYKSINIEQITPELNVGTALSRPMKILGWIGVLSYIIVLFTFGFIYIMILRKLNSKFTLIGVATLNTIFILTIYSNMLQATGMSFQLIYPIIFGIYNSFCEYKSNKFKTLEV